MRVGSLPFALLVISSPAVALGGGFAPSAAPPLDPVAQAAWVVEFGTSSSEPNRYGWGGGFAGDLNGDGRDDVVLPGAGDQLEIFFGVPDVSATDPVERSGAGDARLSLPSGCRDEGRLAWVPLGDVDGDGRADIGLYCPDVTRDVGGSSTLGAAAIWLGRPAWPTVVAQPDLWIAGEPVDALAVPPTGARIRGLAPAGDINGDGRGDFILTGASEIEADVPLAWVFRGASDPAGSLASVADATWTIVGGDEAHCLLPLQAGPIGDVDGDGGDDFGLYCPREPFLGPLPDNDPSIAGAFFLAAQLTSGGGTMDFEDLSFEYETSPGIQLLGRPWAPVGDVDGDGNGEFIQILYVDANRDGVGDGIGARMVRGGDAAIDDVEPTDPYGPFLFDDPVDHPDVLQLTLAGDVRDEGTEFWFRWGAGSDARVGLLRTPDISVWADSDVPPVSVSFTAAGGATLDESWRLGIGGPGDFDGDGVPDLLLVSGRADGGCEADRCSGAYLLRCADADGDGASVCGGDCDDTDGSRGPTLQEVCDAIDHDCDGFPGTVDGDGDGVAPCAGDCDDADPAVGPGAEETCDAEDDANCDGLLPSEDQDGDGAVNCEDCQPWNPALYPGADEACDGLDTDCDGETPRAEQDVDRDGWRPCGDEGAEVDCDDGNPFIHPRRFEDCHNGLDDDCNGQIDESRDADGDGVGTCDGDCYDVLGDAAAATIFPGAEELCDGLDNDCNGRVDDRRDGDGDGVSVCWGDCADSDPLVHRGRVEVCEADEDGNCDGLSDLIDNDGDGFSACSGDCDDLDPGTSPAAVEWCDGRDNDCDGDIDPPWDLDGDGWASCLGDCDDGNAAIRPLTREPDCTDGADGDCDGQFDGLDPDCPLPPEIIPEIPRPYGLSCADCGASQSGGSAGLFASLLLLGVVRRRRGARPGGLLLGLLAGALLLPTPAHAKRREAGAVIYISRLPDVRSMNEATNVADGIDAQEVIHHTELLEDVGAIVGLGVELRTCPDGDASRGPDLNKVSSAALDKMIELDHAGVERLVDDALDGLPCLRTELPRRVLPELLYLRGVARLEQGRQPEAEDDFARCLALDATFAGDPNLPPEINRVLEKVRGRVAVAETPLDAYLPPGTSLRIDGRAVTSDDLPMGLTPGRHVIQFKRDRTLDTALVDVGTATEFTPVVLHGADRMQALRDVRVQPAARAFAVTVLEDLALNVDVDLVALVDFDAPAEPLRYVYRPSIRAFSFDAAFEDSRSGRSATRSRQTERDKRAQQAERRRAQGGGSGRGEQASASSSREATAGPEGGSARGGSAGSSGGTSAGASGGGSGGTAGGSPGGTTATSARGGTSAVVGDPWGDRFRVRVGGGFVYVMPFAYLEIPIGLSVRLVKGLNVDVDVTAANPGATPEHGAIWLPTASLGLSWRFGKGPVQPRLGAVGRVGLDSSSGSLKGRPGWAVRGGFDFVPPRAGPLLLAIDLRAGMLGLTLDAAVSGSVGLRF